MDRDDPALASQAYNVQKSSLTTESYKVKLIWNKHWHMGKKAKAANTKEVYHNDASFSLCGQTDSQQHWITQCQASTFPRTRSDYIEERAGHHKTVQWMKIVLDMAVKHPQGADVWVGIWPPTLRQTQKHRFERSNPTNNNTLTNISERALG